MTSASTPGGVPPLPGSVPAERLSVERIRGRLEGRHHRLIVADEAELTHAVLVPLYELRGELCVILTKRTTLVTMQKGHVSFPGGRREREDPDLLATALRESFEEIGLAPGHVEIFGRIDDFSTRDGEIFIAGFVGLIDPLASPYPWRPAQTEVAEILEVPLTHLLDPANVTTAPPRQLNGRWWPDDVFHFRGHRVFGATARALRNLLDIALSGP
jgi:8-oxo-dGTP pyrophosphatase MutT (NUDIX family)